MLEDRRTFEPTESMEDAERLFIGDFDTWDMTGYYLYSKLLRADVSAHIGTWGSDHRLYLKRFEATAWKTSKDWIGDNGLGDLWSFLSLHRNSVAQVVSKLKNLPTTASAAQARAYVQAELYA